MIGLMRLIYFIEFMFNFFFCVISKGINEVFFLRKIKKSVIFLFRD